MLSKARDTNLSQYPQAKHQYSNTTSSLFSSTRKTMGFRLPGIRRSASFAAKSTASKSGQVPKGYLAVYAGEDVKRFVIPISYLNQPSFQELLGEAEEEFGFDHPRGALTIPCAEDVFVHVTSSFNGC